MKIYTTLKSIPELSGLTADERKEAWDRHASKSYKSWKVMLAVVVMFALVILGSVLRSILKVEFPQVYWGFIDIPILITTYSLGFFLIYQAQVRVVLSFIRKMSV